MAGTLSENEAIQKMRSLISEHGDKGWDQAWKQNVTPWDRGDAQPSLKEALGLPSLVIPERATALVPGCGRGYDALSIASELKCRVIGMDLAPAAIAAANEYLTNSVSRNLGLDVTFIDGDFFAEDASWNVQGFDLVFDHTFFCAIPLSLRGKWGVQMSKIIKPGGYLIALAFPLDGPRQGGPPYSVSLEAYQDVLGLNWELVEEKIPKESIKEREGREKILVWRKMNEARAVL